MEKLVKMPEILTANTYFWKPSKVADARRHSERKRLQEVAHYFEQLGFEVEINLELKKVFAKKDELDVMFYYEESSSNVYKRLEVLKNGKKSNIKALQNLK